MTAPGTSLGKQPTKTNRRLAHSEDGSRSYGATLGTKHCGSNPRFSKRQGIVHWQMTLTKWVRASKWKVHQTRHVNFKQVPAGRTESEVTLVANLRLAGSANFKEICSFLCVLAWPRCHVVLHKSTMWDCTLGASHWDLHGFASIALRLSHCRHSEEALLKRSSAHWAALHTQWCWPSTTTSAERSTTCTEICSIHSSTWGCWLVVLVVFPPWKWLSGGCQ